MALHVTTEVGRPGRKERERRHFNERRGYEEDLVRGRRYINPGRGEQPEWNPHSQKRDIKYSDVGLDWKSRTRYIPVKNYTSEYPEEVTLPKLRCYPGKHCTATTTAEWTAYPEGMTVGKKCRFLNKDEMEHVASLTSTNEVTHTMMLGKNRKLYTTWDRRGQFPAASGGDKSYQVPEYSPGFHSFGSTRPVVNFGGTVRLKADTFVPLQELPPEACERFTVKDRRRKYEAEVESVIALNDWTPAAPLAATSF